MPIVWIVLIAVPRAGDAPINDFAFPKGAILVGAHIRDSGDFTVIFEHGDDVPRLSLE